MDKDVEISIDELLTLPESTTELWVQNSVRDRIQKLLPFRLGDPCVPAPDSTCVVVVGGGTLLDTAKAWRADHSPSTQLIAMPSIWGSGAEVSPIVVQKEQNQKKIRVDNRFLPDKVCYLSELAEEVSLERARVACGDSWSHAIEGFLSPLADDTLRKEIASLITNMMTVPLGNSPEWFRLSAAACSAQARSSVGLIHGIAHTLEYPLRERFPSDSWGHAKLCSVFLAPVLAFNSEESGKSSTLFRKYDVDEAGLHQMSQDLYDPEAFSAALPLLVDNWRTILRDQCTRTNVRLVRRPHLKFFEEWSST